MRRTQALGALVTIMNLVASCVGAVPVHSKEFSPKSFPLPQWITTASYEICDQLAEEYGLTERDEGLCRDIIQNNARENGNELPSTAPESIGIHDMPVSPAGMLVLKLGNMVGPSGAEGAQFQTTARDLLERYASPQPQGK